MATVTRAKLDAPAAGSLRVALAERIEIVERDVRESHVDFLDWARRVPEPKGPLDFRRFPFQPEMYRALASCREGVVMKSVQVGVSAFLVRWTMFWPDTRGVTALYVFPKAKHMFDFADARVRPLIQGSEYLREREREAAGPKNKGLRKIGLGLIYYRGSESKDDLQSVDADLVALDEYDDLNPANIPDAERRITGSNLGLIRRVGVPTTPEWGVARAYSRSDMRRWFVECEACGEWQHIDFYANVEIELDNNEVRSAKRVCRHCRRDLDVSKGEWVAEYPEREVPGFHVSRLISPYADLKSIAVASREKAEHKIETFVTKDLGLPHSTAQGGLDRETIAAAISAAESRYGGPVPQLRGYAGESLVTMGVDVASSRNLNVRISEHLDSLYERGHKKRALFIGEAESFDEVARLLDRYGVTLACIDHMPEQRLALGLAERYAGRVYVVHYASNQFEPLVVDTESRKVGVRRVPAFDATIDVMRAQRNLLPGELPGDYADHMVANRRRRDKDQFGRETVVYERSGPDDYFQAEVYDLVATEVLKIRLEVAAVSEPEVTSLDEQLEFQRSDVNDYNSTGWRPGPGEGGWRPGPGAPFDDDLE